MDASELHAILERDLARRAGASPLLEATMSGISGTPSASDLVCRVLARLMSTPHASESTLRALLEDASPDEDGMTADVSRYTERDFTADGPLDIVLFSAGFHALATHRVAHGLWHRGARDDARLLSAMSTASFGAEIHPSATIGRRLFLDHGQGVVIGETATIGDDCAIFHGVTLGSTARAPGQRHPTLGDEVIVGAGAQIIGAILVGDGARIAPNAVVTSDVPPGGRAD